MENPTGNKPERKRTSFTLNYAPILVIALFGVMLWYQSKEPTIQTIPYGKFKQLIGAPGITFRSLKVGRNDIRGEIITRDNIAGPEDVEPKSDQPHITSFKVLRLGVERDEQLYPLLDKYVVDYQAEEEDKPIQTALSTFLWLALMLAGGVAILFLSMRFFGGSPFSFGRSRHKVFAQKDSTKITFEDVAGIDEAKAELREVVDFLKKPEKYQALGGRIPKGVLLVGPPGTGKTLLARSVAGEAGVPFFSISGSDFVELFAGVGASRVRDLFRDAESNAPCIIFIDELDAMGKTRSSNSMMSHEEREQTLNQLLVEMDGFDTNRGVILMAATNRPETLDAALLRPGRFDRTVVVDRPDIDGREAILKVHARTVKLAPDVNLRKIAALTPGAAGADLANLVNEGALLAARRGKSSVTMSELDEAVERGAVGLERRSRVMRPEEKNRVAVHEAGHALVACVVDGCDPVHKVSIIPRGMAGGYVLQRPDGDRTLITRHELEARIKVALGGTIAEEIILGEISTGATSDLQTVNDIAQRMVREFGMSRLGRVYHAGEQNSFLPGFMEKSNVSEQTSREIDLEVRSIIEQCVSTVRDLIANNQPALNELAQCLIDKEVIEGRELYQILSRVGAPLTEAAMKTLLESKAEIP
ncbi:ATP-dependent zinc metalloprotease FtsH [Telmatocola sphagniphila]|uniref:ATP-dependent zinc metalloprotease FtsH n=1 Tax=Telmatocola sphagniphila TaxID=1123043 RepID=A0A8E6EUF8_9BACT|nr:ATP-dependent zinc metalloprotease FtsH [Telmatocola sphagniphila]QVL33664.1 ATP-dependent zinc metalloprotease FtsH [Telmatocola sphagniphila]